MSSTSGGKLGDSKFKLFERCRNHAGISINWGKFAKDFIIKWIPPDIEAFDIYTNAITAVSKKNVPRNFRKDYISGWSEYFGEIYEKLDKTDDHELEIILLNTLNNSRKAEEEGKLKI